MVLRVLSEQFFFFTWRLIHVICIKILVFPIEHFITIFIIIGSASSPQRDGIDRLFCISRAAVRTLINLVIRCLGHFRMSWELNMPNTIMYINFLGHDLSILSRKKETSKN